MSLTFKNVHKISRRPSRSRSRTRNICKNIYFEKSAKFFDEQLREDFPPLKYHKDAAECLQLKGTSINFSHQFAFDAPSKGIVGTKPSNCTFTEEYHDKSFEELRWEDYKLLDAPKLTNKSYSQCLIKSKFCCHKNQGFMQISGNPLLNYLEGSVDTSDTLDASKPMDEDQPFPDQIFNQNTIISQAPLVFGSNNNRMINSTPGCSHWTPTLSTVNLDISNNYGTPPKTKPINKSLSLLDLAGSPSYTNRGIKFQSLSKTNDSVPETKLKLLCQVPPKTCQRQETQVFVPSSETCIYKNTTNLSFTTQALKTISYLTKNFNFSANVPKTPIADEKRSSTDILIFPDDKKYGVDPKTLLSKISEESTQASEKVTKERSIHTINEPLIPLDVSQNSMTSTVIHNSNINRSIPVTNNVIPKSYPNVGTQNNVPSSSFLNVQIPSLEPQKAHQEQHSIFPNRTWFLRDNISDQFGFNQTLYSVEPTFEHGNLYAECYGYNTVALDLFKTINPQGNPVVSRKKDFHAIFSPYMRSGLYMKNVVF